MFLRNEIQVRMVDIIVVKQKRLLYNRSTREDDTMYFYFAIILLLLTLALTKWKPRLRPLFIQVNTVILLIYIIWRFTAIPTHSPSSFIAGYLLIGAEMIGISQFLIFEYMFSKTYKIEKKNLKSYREQPLPTVDILICTYNEPIQLVEKTIAASLNIRYPKDKMKVYVCDDGKRSTLEQLCKAYGVGYITRIDNEGAKAGNINNALNYIKGDLFVVLDADMIPTQAFLEKTIGYFEKEEVAFVQTPQVYYNQDMYQYNLGKSIPNEQDFFMRDVQEARAAIGAVLHVGTNAVFRKQYVCELGGYPTCSITEDMAVGMLLQAQGYETIFINEVLVLGLSATTYTDLIQQRDRWCRGNLQVIKHFNPLTMKGLKWKQKIAYFDGVLYWFSSVQKMIFIMAPLCYLLFGVLMIDSSVQEILKYFLPYLLGQYLIFKAFSPNTRTLRWSHVYEVAMAPHITLSVLKELFCLNIRFNVTPKEVVSTKPYFQFRGSLPHIIIASASVLAWIIGTYALVTNTITMGAYSINMLWSIYNFIGAVVSIYVAYQKPIYRNVERIELKRPMNINIECDKHSYEGQLKDISEKGLGMELMSLAEFELGQSIKVYLKNEEETIVIEGYLARQYKKHIGIEFTHLSPQQMSAIIKIYTDHMKAFYEVEKEMKYIDKRVDSSWT